MANNVNTNLAQRLFAYIQHKVDLTDKLAGVYSNSMIFIGDEQQIYIPSKAAYVGIGTTAYNNTLSVIEGVKDDIAQLKKELGSNSVKGIYVQWSPANQLPNSQHVNYNYQKLSGDLTISGIDDYNPATGFAYQGNVWAYTYSDGTWHTYGDANGALVPATSGISLTYVYDEQSETIGDYTVLRPVNNRIVIDDKKTWSYMLSSYAYSLNFTRDYTNYEIENLYQNLLGIGQNVLKPVTLQSLFTIDPTKSREANDKYIYGGGTVYHWGGQGDPVMPAEGWDGTFGTLPSGWVEDTSVNFYTVEPTYDQEGEITNPGTINTTNYYTLVSNYNNTYNTNISDGIQTLKEIAYILDQLSDGGIGETTYIQKSTWQDLTSDSTKITEVHQVEGDNTSDIVAISYTQTVDEQVVTTTYYRVITGAGHPTTNSSKYAYYVNTINPENLGIQIAYSIAGNTADIQDLHNHVELAEDGQTTLRSISHVNIPGNLLTVSQITNRTFIDNNTDTQQSLPDATYYGTQTYTVGDTRMYMHLDLASTYVTFNNVDDVLTNHTFDGTQLESVKSVTDVERLGIFEEVDLTTCFGTKPAGTYYMLNNGTMTALASGDSWPTSLDEVFDNYISENKKVYWVRQQTIDNSYLYANTRFEKVDANYVTNHMSETFYTVSNGKYTQVTTNVAGSANYYKVSKAGSPYVQHALVDTANHIATTTWVISYISDTQGAIEEQIAGVLDQAKQYTDEKIDALDTNYKTSYTEFYTYWYQNGGSTYYDPDENSANHHVEHAPGTTAYADALNSAYTVWVDWLKGLSMYEANDSVVKNESFTFAYIYNKLRSQFISNVSEENGIITAETKELPTDAIDVKSTIWNAQENGKVVYQNIIINDGGDESALPDSADTLLEKLFAIVYNSGNIIPIYAKYNDGTANDKAYVAVAEPNAVLDTTTIGGIDITAFYVKENDGTFTQLSTAANAKYGYDTYKAFVMLDHDSFYWKQLYQLQDAMYEVIVDSITTSDNVNALNNTIATCSILRNGVATPITVDLASNPFWKVQTNENNSTKYIDATVKHYDYTQNGGQGQNKIDLSINITRIEDATSTNTGLADAYDIHNYIENMFTWVDISASVSAEQLETIAGFYTPITLTTSGTSATDTCTAVLNSAKTTYGDVYMYHTQTGKYVSIYGANAGEYFSSSYTVNKLGKDLNGDVVYASSSSCVPGSEFWSLSYEFIADTVNHVDMVQTFTTTQTAFINPLNMTLTQVQ